MKAERARIARLRRLERVRAIARQTALAEAARAEGTLAQLAGLAERTGLLASEYARRDDSATAAELAAVLRFASGMRAITRNAGAEAETARGVADLKAREVAEAERRRAAVEDRAVRETGALARKEYASTPNSGARKPGWHGS